MNEERLVDLLAEYDEIIDRTEPDILYAEDGTVVAEVTESTVVTTGSIVDHGIAADRIATGTISADRLTAGGHIPGNLGPAASYGGMIISQDGTFRTLDSDGNEVVRIDRNGIHISGAPIVGNPADRVLYPIMQLQVETPEETSQRTEGEGIRGLIRELFRNPSRTGR